MGIEFCFRSEYNLAMLAHDLETALAREEYRLVFPRADKRAEIERALFPSQVASFERHRHSDGLPPTQSEFIRGFVEDYAPTWPSLFVPRLRPATEYRLSKTHPSLVRDLHLYLLLKENTPFDVKRDVGLDEVLGIDILLRAADGREFYICATVGTTGAVRWRQVKQSLRDSRRLVRREMTGKGIELPLSAAPMLQVGDFWLYSRAHVEMILGLIGM